MDAHISHGPDDSTLRSPTEIARLIAFYIYVPVAAAWILGTDLVAAVWYGEFDLLWLNMLKGAGFAVVTGLALYWGIRRVLTNRESRERDLRTLTKNVPDLIFRLRVRPELEFEYVSPASVDIAGYTPEEHYEDTAGVLSAVHPEDRERMEAVLADVEPDLEATDVRWVHKDGRIVWTDIRFRKERGPDGEVIRLSGVLRDVTAQRESERLRDLLAKALEAAGESVLITDPDGTIEYVNGAFTEITGFDPEEAIGQTPRILRSGEQDESFYAHLWSTIASGRTFRGVFRNRRADGRLYEQATSITPVRGSDGKIEHYIAVARDITVQRALERRLRFTEKMDAVGQLAAGVAHDFRNLLNVILVNAELLEADSDARAPGASRTPSTGGNEVFEILSATRRGADLVGRLLQVARQHELDLRSTDLGALVRGMQGMFRAMVVDSVVLDVRLSEDPIFARVDPDLLQDALLNLVANAGQATPPGGRVVVGLDVAGQGDEAPVRIIVRDTGTGMDETTLALIFDPFFTTKESGTGLGLPMVKSTVEMHDGTLEVMSTPGQGTTVTILLPMREATSMGVTSGTEAVEEDAVAAQERGGQGRILLVEDDSRLRTAAERALRRLGYEVTSSENGRLAFDRIEDSPDGFDLVLSDLVMPELGGLELYEEVQQRGWTIPFLFMSGHGPEAVSSAREAEGAYTFLEKPWTLDKLAATVRDAIANEQRTA